MTASTGAPTSCSGVKDIMWLNPGGGEMSDDEWGTHFMKTLGILLSGEARDVRDVRDWHGNPVHDDTFLLLLNAAHEGVDFILPALDRTEWSVVLDTTEEAGFVKDGRAIPGGSTFPLADRSLVLLRCTA